VVLLGDCHAAQPPLGQSIHHCRNNAIRRRRRKNGDGACIAAQPISGFPLAGAIGLSPLNEFWIAVSLGLFVLAVACWLAAFRVETRIRRLSRQSALNAVALPDHYRRMFHVWSALAAAGLLATMAIFALMIWQPRLD